MNIEIFVDIDSTTNVSYKLTACATIVNASFSVNWISSFGEAIKIEIPEVILVDVCFKEAICCGNTREVFCEGVFNIFEFHDKNFSPFDFSITNIKAYQYAWRVFHDN